MASERSRVGTRRTRAGRGRLSREAILEVATAIATEQDLDQLSMRKIADRLGVAPMSIYEYFENKQEIENAVAAAFLAESIKLKPFTPGDSWQDELRAMSHTIFDALTAHPSLVRVWSYPASHAAPETLFIQEHIHAVFTKAGVPAAQQRTMMRLLASFIIGSAFTSLNSFDKAAGHFDEMLSAAVVV